MLHPLMLSFYLFKYTSLICRGSLCHELSVLRMALTDTQIITGTQDVIPSMCWERSLRLSGVCTLAPKCNASRSCVNLSITNLSSHHLSSSSPCRRPLFLTQDLRLVPRLSSLRLSVEFSLPSTARLCNG